MGIQPDKRKKISQVSSNFRKVKFLAMATGNRVTRQNKKQVIRNIKEVSQELVRFDKVTSIKTGFKRGHL